MTGLIVTVMNLCLIISILIVGVNWGVVAQTVGENLPLNEVTPDPEVSESDSAGKRNKGSNEVSSAIQVDVQSDISGATTYHVDLNASGDKDLDDVMESLGGEESTSGLDSDPATSVVPALDEALLQERIMRAERLITGAEESASEFVDFCRSHARKLKVLGGAILTLYGDRFVYTTLVLQAVRSGGLPNIKTAIDDLTTTYHESRDAVREEILSGALDPYPHHVLYSLQRSLRPERLKTVLNCFMMTFALAVASVTSTTAGAITMGLSLGSTISSKVTRLFDRVITEIEKNADVEVLASDRVRFVLSSEGQRMIRGGVQVGTNLMTILFAAKFQRLAMVLATCAMGSRMLLDSTLSMMYAALARLGLDQLTLRDWPLGADLIQSGLMWFGFWSQVRPGAHGLPIILSVPLLPFHVLEGVLRSLVRTRV